MLNVNIFEQTRYISFYCRVHKSIQRKHQNNIVPSNDELDRKELRKASVLIWISVVFIVCQSVKIIPDFYEAFYCDHKEVNSYSTLSILHVIQYSQDERKYQFWKLTYINKFK